MVGKAEGPEGCFNRSQGPYIGGRVGEHPGCTTGEVGQGEEEENCGLVMPGRVLESGVLFSIATDAARGITAEPRQDGQTASLVSIVFVVISLEAFLNEAAEVAHDVREGKSEPEAVAAFAQLMKDSERASLESKFVLSNWLLTGKRIDTSRQPYQNFSSLLNLRNALVHFDPNEPWNTFEEAAILRQKKIIASLESQNILATKVWGHGSWTSSLQTKAVARWACNAASQMVFDFVKKAPTRGQWAFHLKHTRRSFEIHSSDIQ
jgi:hypothetical protein